ncbi:MAG: XRE family transcriptional regulator [Anaerolineales bacterium]|nr:XRE family transcriptional regulator [Anaerolineales bacterium]MCS7248616.1 XRE family transcriptional regulator [Anaerolineales bacterium]MDW8162429.1 XRE family transcriptional regulator [Anaerolineales bacterium]MDW8446350.1 XRE family transcriptional regulator [Anaerolineales bacterium]
MDTIITGIGQRIHEMRLRREWTLEELAQKTNCTPGFLSQLENGKVAPSITTLYAIAEALGIKITDFFPETIHPPKVVRKGERQTFRIEGSSVIYSPLMDRLPRAILQSFILTLLPPNQGLQYDEERAHFGEEFYYVLSGVLRVRIENTFYDLFTGDSIYFHSSYRHRLLNPTEHHTVVLCMITPAIF